MQRSSQFPLSFRSLKSSFLFLSAKSPRTSSSSWFPKLENITGLLEIGLNKIVGEDDEKKQPPAISQPLMAAARPAPSSPGFSYKYPPTSSTPPKSSFSGLNAISQQPPPSFSQQTPLYQPPATYGWSGATSGWNQPSAAQPPSQPQKQQQQQQQRHVGDDEDDLGLGNRKKDDGSKRSGSSAPITPVKEAKPFSGADHDDMDGERLYYFPFSFFFLSVDLLFVHCRWQREG